MSRYDSLAGVDTIDADDSRKTISQFQDNYRYYRSQGHSHTEAKNMAIDYHRRYTARECTDNWDEFSATVEDERLTQYDLVLYNQTVTALAASCNPKQMQFLFATIRFEQLEDQLNENNLRLCHTVCADFYPDSVREIAEWMGFSIRKNGSCNSIVRYRQQLAELAARFRPGQMPNLDEVMA